MLAGSAGCPTLPSSLLTPWSPYQEIPTSDQASGRRKPLLRAQTSTRLEHVLKNFDQGYIHTDKQCLLASRFLKWLKKVYQRRLKPLQYVCQGLLLHCTTTWCFVRRALYILPNCYSFFLFFVRMPIIFQKVVAYLPDFLTNTQYYKGKKIIIKSPALAVWILCNSHLGGGFKQLRTHETGAANIPQTGEAPLWKCTIKCGTGHRPVDESWPILHLIV